MIILPERHPITSLAKVLLFKINKLNKAMPMNKKCDFGGRKLILILSFTALFHFPFILFSADSGLQTFNKSIKPLLEKHCTQCHGPKKQKGDFRIDNLNPDMINGSNAGFWHEALNQINDGEMPPEDEKQFSEKELELVTSWLELELHKAAAHRNSTGGRQVMRRMNRYEYHYTLKDLLGIQLDYSESTPSDLFGEDGLKTNARFLGMSMVQMESYLEVAEAALEEAIPDTTEKLITGKIDKVKLYTSRIKKSYKSDKKAKASKYLTPAPSLFSSSTIHDMPRMVTFNERPFNGRFKIKITAKATASSDGRDPELTIQIGHRASGDYVPRKVMGYKTVKSSKKTQVLEFIGNIEDFPLGKKGAYYNGSGSHDLSHMNVWMRNTAHAKNNIDPKLPAEELDEPKLEIVSVEFEGPLLEGYPSEKAKSLVPASKSSNEKEYAKKTLFSFMSRAFRRPVSDEELNRALNSFENFRKLLPDFKSAIRKTMAMVLISPKFIYIVEPSSVDKPRKLNAFELASRLSYFLWASMPDNELFNLAKSGDLLKESVLKQQIRRMQKDPKFERFAKHFSNQWLGLDAMENVAINPDVNRKFSDEIKANLRLETEAFASHVFTNDLNCQNFIDSEFAMLNQIVAKHYGIKGVFGSHFRPVKLKAQDKRGGVLTNGSFMIAGSDGSDANAIYRGVWLKKHFFADPPPPPPPGVPTLAENEDVKKDLTVKEQIALHREAASCSRCHKNIDPWGVAFENYDAVGLWRTEIKEYETIVKTSKPDKKGNVKKTKQFVVKKTSPVDAVTTLPDGKKISGVTGLKKYLLQYKSDELAEALSKRVFGYALGRQLEFSDEATIKELMKRFENKNYRISALIEGIVTNQKFLQK